MVRDLQEALLGGLLRLLHGEEAGLEREATRVASELAVARNDAVARYDQRERIRPVGSAHGANRPRVLYPARDVCVGVRLSIRNLGKCLPDTTLEGSAAKIEGKIEGDPLPVEVLENLAGCRSIRRGVFEDARAAKTCAQPPVETAAVRVGKLDVREALVRRGQAKHPDGRLDPSRVDDLHRSVTIPLLAETRSPESRKPWHICS